MPTIGVASRYTAGMAFLLAVPLMVPDAEAMLLHREQKGGVPFEHYQSEPKARTLSFVRGLSGNRLI
jgi:hypothetical protein